MDGKNSVPVALVSADLRQAEVSGAISGETMDSIQTDREQAQTCTLLGHSFRVQFNICSAGSCSEHVDVNIVIRLGAAGERLLFSSARRFVALKDLLRLADYLESHMNSVIDQTVTEESLPFVPLELAFQVQALYGEASSREEGTFSIRISANARDENMDSNVYVGCEGGIEMDSANTFVRELRQAVASFISE
ncbi:hypothetical protein [Nannocystis radixulma]|uniref:Uncharacterized protein n=1 Tax=Nannocystis radixulma TaxID=2995305 RepID=A0ABT5B3T2_9BACT|nr:hypothetical protein [Nannocystis radixulma]MDC0667731.1 hypothetical protein [Nannocystis radixulma]